MTVVPPPPGQAGPAPSVGQVLRRPETDQYLADVGGTIDSVRTEVDDAYEEMKTFHNRTPDEVMRLCGGHSARLSEIRMKIFRVENMHPQWRPVRTNEVEVALDQLNNQFLIASRLHAVREFDYRLETGDRVR